MEFFIEQLTALAKDGELPAIDQIDYEPSEIPGSISVHAHLVGGPELNGGLPIYGNFEGDEDQVRERVEFALYAARVTHILLNR